MDSAAFVTELEQGLEQVLRRLTPEDALQAELDGDLTVENLLKVALRNELEATEIAARWMATTPEVEVKLAFARQIGDEAKHYRPPSSRRRPGRRWTGRWSWHRRCKACTSVRGCATRPAASMTRDGPAIP